MKVGYLVGALCFACIGVGMLLHPYIFPAPKVDPMILETLQDSTWERDLTIKVAEIERNVRVLAYEVGHMKKADTFYIGDSAIYIDTSTAIGDAPLIEESFDEKWMDYIDGKPYARYFTVTAEYQGFLHGMKYRFRPLKITSPTVPTEPKIKFWGYVDLLAVYSFERGADMGYGGAFGGGIKFFDKISPHMRLEGIKFDTLWDKRAVFGLRGHL